MKRTNPAGWTLNPVVWSKGTFLQAQHFQAQDRYLEALVDFRIQAMSPECWGFVEMDIDSSLLVKNVVSLRRASGVMRDGLAFDFAESDRLPPPLELAKVFRDDQPVIDVFLAIPVDQRGGATVSYASGAEARYLVDVYSFKDETSATNEKPINLLLKNFRLIGTPPGTDPGGEADVGLSTLFVGSFERTGAGGLRMLAASSPPMLDLKESPTLLNVARRAIASLGSRADELRRMRRERSAELAEFTESDTVSFWLLHTVNSHVATLTELLERKPLHPGEFHRALLAVASALTAFSLKYVPTDLPAYAHSNPGPGIVRLGELFQELLDAALPRRYASIPLETTERLVHWAEIKEDRYLDGCRVFIAVASDLGPERLITEVPRLIKVASRAQLRELIDHAKLGVPLSHDPNPPRTIPLQTAYRYFELDTRSDFWIGVKRSRNIAVYTPTGLGTQVSLELLVDLGRQPANQGKA